MWKKMSMKGPWRSLLDMWKMYTEYEIYKIYKPYTLHGIRGSWRLLKMYLDKENIA